MNVIHRPPCRHYMLSALICLRQRCLVSSILLGVKSPVAIYNSFVTMNNKKLVNGEEFAVKTNCPHPADRLKAQKIIGC